MEFNAEKEEMNISVFGLGYVGCVNIVCLAKLGFNVIGVDIKFDKVNLISKGIPTIIEKDVDKLLKEGINRDLIKATLDEKFAIRNSDISLICVGTPNREDGLLDLKHVFYVSKSIAEALKYKKKFHLIVIRSTVIPGTCDEVSKIISSISNKKRFIDFDVVSNPEFLREGSGVYDFFNPPYIVVGTENKSAKAKELMSILYSKLNVPMYFVPTKVAEIIKFINNSWHALKITFANEVGNICKKYGIDSHVVMDLFCKDNLLNISRAYLKPGFAYGGSCLPKDTKALVALGRIRGVHTPILSTIEVSNDYHLKNVFKMIIEKNPKKVALLGISFKEGTDDVRLSPKLKLAKMLRDEGIEVRIHDPFVYESIKNNINLIYIKAELGELFDCIFEHLEEVLQDVDLIIIANKYDDYKDVLDKVNVPIFDLVRLYPGKVKNKNYEGICW